MWIWQSIRLWRLHIFLKGETMNNEPEDRQPDTFSFRLGYWIGILIPVLAIITLIIFNWRLLLALIGVFVCILLVGELLTKKDPD